MEFVHVIIWRTKFFLTIQMDILNEFYTACSIQVWHKTLYSMNNNYNWIICQADSIIFGSYQVDNCLQKQYQHSAGFIFYSFCALVYTQKHQKQTTILVALLIFVVVMKLTLTMYIWNRRKLGWKEWSITDFLPNWHCTMERKRCWIQCFHWTCICKTLHFWSRDKINILICIYI